MFGFLLLFASSCDVEKRGCTDPIAENYDTFADYDDGSCVYILGCTDPLANNWNPNATLESLNICEYSANLVYYLDYSAVQYMLAWGISFYAFCIHMTHSMMGKFQNAHALRFRNCVKIEGLL